MSNWEASKYAWKKPAVYIPMIIALFGLVAFWAYQTAVEECAKPIEERNEKLDPDICNALWEQYIWLALGITMTFYSQINYSYNTRQYRQKHNTEFET